MTNSAARARIHLAAIGLALAAPLAALAQGAPPARAANGQPVGEGITFNQAYIENLTADRGFAIDDVMDAFAHVFDALAPVVNVYPTENYYYFSFIYKGLVYAGNMRLDVKDRDEGVLHFAYFNQGEDWNTELVTQYRPLSAVDGVKVEKVKDLVYRVTFKEKAVIFALNDLSAMRPPETAVGEGEIYLGPVFDESGVRFFLMFHAGDKRFSYVLDESGPLSEQLSPFSEADLAIQIGMRTGFAFYKDRFRDRKILIGVYAGNVENNNYFDGPFDQLPDNFLKGSELRDAILTVYPDLKDQIDRFGNFKEQEGRVLINPYINYSFVSELEAYRRCTDPLFDRAGFYRCLQASDGQ